MSNYTVATIFSAFVAEAAPSIEKVSQMNIPPVVMEAFQCLAWASAGVIAFVGVMKYIKNVRTQKEEEEE